MKEYKEQNKDKIKEYREQNKDKMKEYREQNKDKIKQQEKEYREQNKDKINERRNTKCLCGCGKEYLLRNKSTHQKTIFHQNWLKENS